MVRWLSRIMYGHNDIVVLITYNRVGAFHHVRCFEESRGLVADG